MASSKPKKSFSDFPAEIRLKIYRLAVPINTAVRTCGPDSLIDDYTLPTRLLQVDKMFRQEVAALFFGENTFVCE